VNEGEMPLRRCRWCGRPTVWHSYKSLAERRRRQAPRGSRRRPPWP
jgi:hypothetical protein